MFHVLMPLLLSEALYCCVRKLHVLLQVMDFLGSAAFSKAVQALDTKTGMLVCLKIIKVTSISVFCSCGTQTQPLSPPHPLSPCPMTDHPHRKGKLGVSLETMPGSSISKYLFALSHATSRLGASAIIDQCNM